jgi:hypothetical protein
MGMEIGSKHERNAYCTQPNLKPYNKQGFSPQHACVHDVTLDVIVNNKQIHMLY